MSTSPIPKNFPIPDGSHWVINVPPSWIFGVTVIASTEDEIQVKDVAYLENTPDGKTTIGDVPASKNAAEQLRACSQSYAIPDGTIFRRDAILIRVPSAIDFKALARRNAANAIKGAR